MFIVIEGCDKSGKSTLANAIAERFGCTVKHFGKPGKSPATEYATFALGTNDSIVCDRYYLGELVYGPMFRGKAGISDLEFVTLERILRRKQAILIQTTTDVTLANKRLLVSTQDEMVDELENFQAAKRFNEVIGRSNIQKIIKYDGSTRENLNNLLRQLEQLVDWAELDQTTIQKVCTGIGTPVGPKLVFVGEAVNQRATWLNLPFDKGFSSQFLLDSFKAANVPEDKVYIVNADTLESPEVDFLTGDKTVFISLGKVADAKLKLLDVPHEALAHPQFIKRFQWKNKGQYVKDLKAIIKEAYL